MFDKFKEIVETQGAVANGVLFKQEPVSNVEQNAAPAVFRTFAVVPTISERKESAVLREIRKEAKTRKTRKPHIPKPAPKKRPSSKTPSQKGGAKRVVSEELGTDGEKEKKEEKETKSAWVEPNYWTRSRARAWDERKMPHRSKKETMLNVVTGSSYSL